MHQTYTVLPITIRGLAIGRDADVIADHLIALRRIVIAKIDAVLLIAAKDIAVRSIRATNHIEGAAFDINSAFGVVDAVISRNHVAAAGDNNAVVIGTLQYQPAHFDIVARDI